MVEISPKLDCVKLINTLAEFIFENLKHFPNTRACYSVLLFHRLSSVPSGGLTN